MVEKKEIIKVGLIGYGYVGKTFHAPFIDAVEGLELSAIVSSHPETVREDWPDMAVYPDIDIMLSNSNVDLVVIATPNDTHKPLAERALLAGRHVVVDKPFTLTTEDARYLAALAEKEKKLLSVFQNRRWDSDFLGVKQAIEKDLLGDIAQFESHLDRFRPVVRQRWREEAVAGGGLWYDLAPHMVDQALDIFGLPDNVQASFAAQRSGAKTTDWVHVILSYGEKRVILQGSMLVAGGTARFTLHGEKGSLIKRYPDPQEAQLRSGMKPLDKDWGKDADLILFWDADGKSSSYPTPSGDQTQYYREIYEALTGSASNPVTPIQAIAVMAVIEAAILSNQSGERIAPDLTNAEKQAFEKK
ncbi:MAG: oxidoreductase [Zymomonas mobilis]|uniref:oxidoreductase n=1 Tax=Zymomonas mobilis TaxID=542 RepID=UPI0001B706CD|nr:oxidoreductase [Zymomonas mobilis]ACV75932.1 oxidoreductase domain protein [Zymomonas mobilis subsp. mobilis NCIMB 11163]